MAASSNGARVGRAEGTLKALQPYQWKPGQSGNPKGPPPGSRRKLSEEFLADLHAASRAYGRPAQMTAAFTDPVSFVRVVASLMPKELEAAVTVVNAERMSDDELAAIACQGGEDPLATEEEEEIFQPVE